MKNFFHAGAVTLSLTAVLLMAGCGGGGGGGSASGQAGDVNAYVSKGPLTDSECSLYSASNNQKLAGPVKSTHGRVSFPAALPAGFYDVAYVECLGGTYKDEATGQSKALDSLRGANKVQAGGQIVVTPLTELAVRKAGGDMSKVEEQAKVVALAMGLGEDVDILSVPPTDLNTTAVASTTSAADKYGIVLASIAALTQNKTQGDTTTKVISSLEQSFQSDGKLTPAVTSELKNAVQNLSSTANAEVKANLGNTVGIDTVATNLGTQQTLPYIDSNTINTDPAAPLLYGASVTITATGTGLTTASVSITGGICQTAQVTATGISSICTVGSTGTSATVSINYGGAAPATKSIAITSAPVSPPTPAVTSVSPIQGSYNAVQAFAMNGVFTSAQGAVSLDGASCASSLSGSTITATCTTTNDRSKTSQTLTLSGFGLSTAFNQTITLNAPAVVLASSTLTNLTQRAAAPSNIGITGTGLYSGLVVKLNNVACQSSGVVNGTGTAITGINCSNITLPAITTSSSVALSLSGNSMAASGNVLSTAIPLVPEPAAIFEGWSNGNALTCTVGRTCSNAVRANNCGASAAVGYSIAAADQAFATVDASTGAITANAATTNAITVTATQAVVPGVCLGGATSYSLSISPKPTASLIFSVSTLAPVTWNGAPQNYTNAATATCSNQPSGVSFAPSITYSSSDSANAPVSAAGVLTLNKAGSYVITASVAETAYCAAGSQTYSITVNKATPVLSFATASKSMTYGDTGAALASPAVSGMPTDATGALSYSCAYTNPQNETDGCVVSNTGLLEIEKSGSGTVQVNFAGDDNYNAATASYALTVTPRPLALSFATTALTKTIGDATFINAITTAPTGFAPNIVYSTSNTAVAKIDNTFGIVTPVGVGTATITAHIQDANYSGADATYSVEVTAKPTPSAGAALLSTAPAASYSLRKIGANATNAINVRRSSDNATLDIGFDSSGNLDTTSLTNFCGSNSCYVVTWYDQSGNGRNAAQTTAALQPRIVDAGTIETINGRPALRFVGGALSGGLHTAGNKLTVTSWGNVAQPFTWNTVFKKFASNQGYHYLTSNNGTNLSITFDSFNRAALYAGGGSLPSSTTFDNSKANLITAEFNGASSAISLNGTRQAFTSTVGTSSFGGLCIGANFLCNAGFYNGWVAEITVVASSIASADRSLLEGNQMPYFGISAPPAPKNLRATQITPTSLSLTWDAEPSATSYQYGYSGGTLATVTGNAATLTGLTPGTRYGVEVYAVNNYGSSTSINQDFDTISVYGAPAQPTNVKAVVGNGKALLTWMITSDGGSAISGYLIQYKRSDSSTWITFPYSGTSPSVVVNGLTNGVNYDFRIIPINNQGQGTGGDIAGITPRAVPEAPAAPVISALTSNSVALSWSVPVNMSTAAITGYRIYDGAGNLLASPSSTTYTLNNLTPLTNYSFVVAAVNANGESPRSDSTLVQTVDIPRPGSVTGLSGVAGSGAVTLTWNAPTNGTSAAVDYKIEYFKQLTMLNLGDSITDASGYRSVINNGLNNLYANINTAGSTTDGTQPTSPANQQKKEGHASYSTLDGVYNLDGFNKFTYATYAGTTRSSNGGYWLTGTATRNAAFPDIVTVYYGANDMGRMTSNAEPPHTSDNAQTNFTTLLNMLYELRPNAKIYLATNPPYTSTVSFGSYSSYGQIANDLNTKIRAAAQPLIAAGRNITLVDLNTNYFVDGGGFADGTHPNASGYSVIGNRFLAAMTTGASAYTGWTTYPHTASNATSITVNGLESGASYFFRVSPVNASGVVGNAVYVYGITPNGPAAPTNLTASAITDTSVTYSWTAVSGASAYEYKVNDGTTTSTTGTSVTINGLTAGTYNKFELRALDSAGVRSIARTIAPKTYANGNLLLSQVSVRPSVAYSVRRLNEFAVWALRVVRSSDYKFMEIGFDSAGNLDSAAMTTFCGTSTCTVSAWYDQSLNGAGAIAASGKPIIVDAGTMVTVNGKPALKFANSPLVNIALGNIAQPFTRSYVLQNNMSSGTCLVNNNPTGAPGALSTPVSVNSVGECFTATGISMNAGGTALEAALGATDRAAIASIYNGASSSIYKNGVQSASGNAGTNGVSDLVVGADNTATAGYFNGYVSELIIFPKALTSTQINTLQTNQRNYFGTP